MSNLKSQSEAYIALPQFEGKSLSEKNLAFNGYMQGWNDRDAEAAPEVLNDEELTAENARLVAELTAANSRVTELDAANESAKTQVAEFETANAETKAQVETLESKVSTLSQEILSLQEGVGKVVATEGLTQKSEATPEAAPVLPVTELPVESAPEPAPEPVHEPVLEATPTSSFQPKING